jgi:hypothetical protein
MLTDEAARRLIALLRILEWGPSGYSVVGDDAVLDAWFGPRSPLPTADRYWAGSLPDRSTGSLARSSWRLARGVQGGRRQGW